MADDGDEEEQPKRGLGLIAWLIVGVLALTLGAGGFYVTYSGMLPFGATAEKGEETDSGHSEIETSETSFVELDPLHVAVGGAGSIRKLQFRAFLQIGPDGAKPVEAVEPRILDIFATYLRALPVATLEDPTALLRIRSQLLRRVQLLTGPDIVEDLLIIDFVIV